MMKTVRSMLVLATSIVACRAACGHGLPIFLSVPAGSSQLATDHRVYTSQFDLLLGVVSTDLPGFSINSSADGVPTGAIVGTHIVDKLWYHDGASILDADADLLIENFDADFVVVDKDTTSIAGPEVAVYDGQPGWHEHYFYTLVPSSAPAGAYGLALEATTPNHPDLSPSQSLVIVFNRGLSEAMFADGVKAIAAQVLKIPGDVNLDGMVDIFDVNVVSANWSTAGPLGDANHDQSVDIFDINVISAHWGDSVLDLAGGGGAATVPEPETLALAVLAALGVLVFKVRRSPLRQSGVR